MAYVTAPDPEFTSQLDKLKSTSDAADKAAILTGQREWMYPPLNGWTGCPWDLSGMNKAFPREHLNEVYCKILGDKNSTGTVGEAMAVKLQVDYIAALERAFRTRHCSSVRARMHSAARRRGQAAEKGLFQNNVLLHIERMIFAAHDDPYAGSE